MAGRVVRFDIRRDGSLGPAGTFARVSDAARSDRYGTPYDETGPDGLEIGPNGELYVAVYGEGRVLRFGRDGTYRGAIELPTRYVTNITFLPDGRAATTGAFDNVSPPFRGEVRFHAPEDLTTTPD
jgi:sugar lactone lactonase YvrE